MNLVKKKKGLKDRYNTQNRTNNASWTMSPIHYTHQGKQVKATWTITLNNFIPYIFKVIETKDRTRYKMYVCQNSPRATSCSSQLTVVTFFRIEGRNLYLNKCLVKYLGKKIKIIQNGKYIKTK